MSLPQPNPSPPEPPPSPALVPVRDAADSAPPTPPEDRQPLFAFDHILDEMADDRRNLRWALIGAALFHALLFFVHFPDLTGPVQVTAAAKEKAYVVRQVRFRPPQAAPKQEIPDRKRKKIPMPDPTPHEPEPVREMTVDLPEMDLDLPVGELNLEIPEGPPAPGAALGAVHVGGDVVAPEKIHAPRPGYTEEARQARIQGMVLIQLVVDAEGKVRDAEIIKGLPMGLDQNALETVRQWTFKPATREGKPVPVYYNVTVSFSLQ